MKPKVELEGYKPGDLDRYNYSERQITFEVREDDPKFVIVIIGGEGIEVHKEELKQLLAIL